MGVVRFFIALWGAKCLRLGMRIFGRNATYLPGSFALKLCPDFLARVKKPGRVIAVTGTNGKTTVSNLLGGALAGLGLRVLDNRLGSNTHAGIAASLAKGVSVFGKTRHDAAVFEVDERSSKRILPFIMPELLIITNLFRDSIMRNAHPEYIAGILSSGIPGSAKLVLNADDLISVAVAPDNPRVYFGIGPMDTDVTECVNLINDIQICPKCSGALVYDYRRYHHIGRARCPECGFSPPSYDYTASLAGPTDGHMTVIDRGGRREYRLLSDSVFNIYNMLTVIAALRELGFTHDEIAERLDNARIPESRYNEESCGGVSVIMQMAKDRNALACSRAFDYVSGKPGDKELILMMNNLSDHKKWSENVCWLYDCDFELLCRDNITRIIATGPRAKDYYLRLLHAGVPEDRLRCTLRELDAPPLLELGGGSVYILYGTDALGLAYQVKAKIKNLAGGERG